MDTVKRLLRWDARAAVVAVIVAIAVFFLSSSPLFAVVMGVVIYWVRTNLSAGRRGSSGSGIADTAERVALSMETAEQKVIGLRTLAGQIERESTRDIVQRISDQSGEVLALMREDNRKAKLAPLYLEQLLEPAEAMLETYLRLRSRGLLTTNELAARTESQDLPMIERASRLFRDQLRTDPLPERKSLEQTLAFNVESPTAIVEPRRTK